MSWKTTKTILLTVLALAASAPASANRCAKEMVFEVKENILYLQEYKGGWKTSFECSVAKGAELVMVVRGIYVVRHSEESSKVSLPGMDCPDGRMVQIKPRRLRQLRRANFLEARCGGETTSA